MKNGTRQEIEEARILQTIAITCRNSGIVAHATVELPPDEDTGQTLVTFRYSRSRAAAWAPVALVVLLIAALVVAWWPGISPWGSICAICAAIFLSASLKRQFDTKLITQEQLNRKVDMDLVDAGFHVERTATSWSIQIPHMEAYE